MPVYASILTTITFFIHFTISVIISQQNKSPSDDIEEDILEAEQKRKRDTDEPQDPDDIKTYDPSIKTNHYESKGSYTLELVGQRRLLRHRRSERSIASNNVFESSLLAFINQSELHYMTYSIRN